MSQTKITEAKPQKEGVMGDRALVIFKSEDEVSPVIYLHWAGESVPALLETHKTLMAERTGDVSYSAARFVGIAHEASPGNLSLGMWNTTPELTEAVLAGDGGKLSEESHGDAGLIVVDATSFEWKAYGGYLEKVEDEAA